MRLALLRFVGFIVVALVSLHARSDWGPVTAHVTLIDAGAMGSRAGENPPPILFTIQETLSGSPCGTGPTVLFFSPPAFADDSSAPGDKGHPTGNDRQMVASKAALSQLQIALVTGLSVKLWGFAGSGGMCQVYIIQLQNS
jgi:hypothetical protein